MENAREELERKIGNTPIKCAWIKLGKDYFDEDEKLLITLPIGGDVESFMKSLDFEYDSGYGGQELFGVVWFENGAWLERYEYDGSEWWVLKYCPDIPMELL